MTQNNPGIHGPSYPIDMLAEFFPFPANWGRDGKSNHPLAQEITLDPMSTVYFNPNPIKDCISFTLFWKFPLGPYLGHQNEWIPTMHRGDFSIPLDFIYRADRDMMQTALQNGMINSMRDCYEHDLKIARMHH